MKGMHIRNGYYVLAQQLRGEIIHAPNTTKKFNELLFVFFIGKEGLPVWWDTEILEFVVRIPIYSLSFTTRWNYKE
jgi:hypothetical protein